MAIAAASRRSQRIVYCEVKAVRVWIAGPSWSAGDTQGEASLTFRRNQPIIGFAAQAARRQD